MKKAVTYYRVSTARQGQSGLGLEAQKKAVNDFAKANGYMLQGEYIEVESGKKNVRPLLQLALRTCKLEDATLLIAKLDRLSRNVVFIGTLLESRVAFKAVDNPYADKLLVHIMAAFAEHEHEQISKRTIAALQAAKLKGVELGYYGRYVLSKKNKENADRFALAMMPILENLNQMGVVTVRDVAKELNDLKVPTFRDKATKWHPSTVHALIKRIEISNQNKK